LDTGIFRIYAGRFCTFCFPLLQRPYNKWSNRAYPAESGSLLAKVSNEYCEG
jgi:hypothetical protein